MSSTSKLNRVDSSVKRLKRKPSDTPYVATAFILFAHDERARVKQECEDAKLPRLTFAEMGIELGSRWKRLTAEERQPYVDEHHRLVSATTHKDVAVDANKKLKSSQPSVDRKLQEEPPNIPTVDAADLFSRNDLLNNGEKEVLLARGEPTVTLANKYNNAKTDVPPVPSNVSVRKFATTQRSDLLPAANLINQRKAAIDVEADWRPEWDASSLVASSFSSSRSSTDADRNCSTSTAASAAANPGDNLDHLVDDSIKLVHNVFMSTIDHITDVSKTLVRQRLSEALLSFAKSSSCPHCKPMEGNVQELTSLYGESQRQVAQLKKRVTDLEDQRRCVVCLTRDRELRFDPCGHVSCCHACGQTSIENPLVVCPVCQASITSRQFCFL